MAIERLRLEQHLGAEWSRQTQRFIDLGFHEELGLSEQEYLDSLPRFGLQPESFKGRFDIPLIVETKIPVVRQCKLAGIDYYLEGLKVCDWPGDPQGYITPEKPYFTWVQDGSRKS